MKLAQNPASGGLSCRDSVYLVSLLRDAELSPGDQALLTRHIDVCKPCQQAKKQFDILHDALDVLLARPPAQATQVLPSSHPGWPDLA